MFENQTAFLLALNFLTEKDKASKEHYLMRISELYAEFETALNQQSEFGDMIIDDDLLKSV
ncbi:hypothetical protein CEQ31_004945 [Serratia odorifera]|uniref:Uncharacterized protein n=2 Tax=Serratia odorifera TaxID=618 RepID=D4E7H8_SEROD|nr:hypothetical protein HMPREF0758_4128 [Serratia odorifera DSM 4582]PNK89095.1 hypothetical protein CEQ31_004945 [Serratia odorifera]RII69875.1 hypothetical protein DX901_21350 [Serratia odorifera]